MKIQYLYMLFKDSLKLFVAGINTLCSKTIDDTLNTAKNCEAARFCLISDSDFSNVIRFLKDFENIYAFTFSANWFKIYSWISSFSLTYWLIALATLERATAASSQKISTPVCCTTFSRISFVCTILMLVRTRWRGHWLKFAIICHLFVKYKTGMELDIFE